MTRRAVWFLLLAGGFLLLPWVSLRGTTGPARARSVPIALAAVGNGAWESEPISAPATVAGLSWQGAPPERAFVRASEDGATWSEWVEIEVVPDAGPDPGTGEASRQRPASAPVYVGEAVEVQYRVVGPDPGALRAELVDTTGRGAGLLERAGLLWRSIDFAPPPRAEAQADQPAGIITRHQWGGDECLSGANVPPPYYVRRVRVLFVHHTAGTNDYTAAEGKRMVRGICEYHVKTLGWNDIAYNFLIDKHGNVYEGRAGGMDRGVQGAHTMGFNSYSTGVAFLGNYIDRPLEKAAREAFVKLAAWKLDVHHVDPQSTATLASKGNWKYPEGTEVTLRAVSGHRDAQSTACPGDIYGLLGAAAAEAADLGHPKLYGGWPSPDPIEGNSEEGYQPATFSLDFTDPAQWTLQVLNEAGTVVLRRSSSGDGSVAWDGTAGGRPLPMGSYEVRVDATSPAGTIRPLRDRFVLGTFLPPFLDDDDSIHRQDIAAIYEAGITRGCNVDGTRYCPKASVTRGEMAAFLVRALELPPSSKDRFADDEGSQFQADIDALAQAGVTKGCDEGGTRFCPEAPVDRKEMAAFLLRGLTIHRGADHDSDRHLAGSESSFSDVPEGTWYTGYVEHLADHRITQGYGDGTYRPEREVSREEMASFLARSFLE